MVLAVKSPQKFPVNPENFGVPQRSILGIALTLFLPHINGLPDDIIYKPAIYADDTTL